MKSKPNVWLAVSDDYAALEVGHYDFYYGYEETVPILHQPSGDYEWAFVAKIDDQEVMRIPTSGLSKRNDEDPMRYLLLGIGKYMEHQQQETRKLIEYMRGEIAEIESTQARVQAIPHEPGGRNKVMDSYFSGEHIGATKAYRSVLERLTRCTGSS